MGSLNDFVDHQQNLYWPAAFGKNLHEEYHLKSLITVECDYHKIISMNKNNIKSSNEHTVISTLPALDLHARSRYIITELDYHITTLGCIWCIVLLLTLNF
jgi:hypothetical protein